MPWPGEACSAPLYTGPRWAQTFVPFASACDSNLAHPRSNPDPDPDYGPNPDPVLDTGSRTRSRPMRCRRGTEGNNARARLMARFHPYPDPLAL